MPALDGGGGGLKVLVVEKKGLCLTKLSIGCWMFSISHRVFDLEVTPQGGQKSRK